MGRQVAQASGPKRSSYAPKKLDEYVAWCPVWRTDATFHSTVRLKNSLDTSPLDATVTLYMADGTPYALPPVHLVKGGVDTVDVNAALAGAPPSIRQHLSSFGSASVKYNYDWQAVVIATMSILDTARSLEYMPSFVFPAKPTPADRTSPPPQAWDGLWWRYGGASAGWLALANTTGDPIGVEVDVSGLSAPAGRSLTLAAHGAVMLDLKDFFAGDPARVGGLHVAYSGAWGAVQVAGGLEDATKGFSADLPLNWHLPPKEAAGPRQVAAAGVMVNQQDPLLNFPASVSFTPYAFFRNISATPKTLHSVVYYMDGRTVKSQPLADLALQPGEAQELPIGDLMSKQPQIQDINLAYSYDGYWGDILAGIGSTDQTGNYVFPVSPAAAYKGGARVSNYWLAADGFDTMYSLWNPEPDAQELLVTLKYGDGQFYKLPVTLESHASTMIDIGELMRTRQLDQDGNLLPPDAKQGSLVVSSPANEPEDGIDVVLGIGIYNPTKATCGVECGTCNGIIDSFMDPASWLYSVGAGQQLRSGYYDNLGYQYDITNSSSWSSSASQVIGVQTSGQQTPGMSTAVSVGSAQLTAAYWNNVPYYYVQACLYDDPLPCQFGPVQTQGGGTVTPPPVIEDVTPNVVMAGSSNVPVTITGSGFGTSATVNLPAGAAVVSGSQKTADGTITFSVNVSANATFGTGSVTVTANSVTSAGADFTLDGPTYMTVVSDFTGTCSGCSTTVQRVVTYQIMNFSGASSNTIPICESPSRNSYNCQQLAPLNYNACTAPVSATSGSFADQWSLGSDVYTPVGCGYSTTDPWMWAYNATVLRTFATLSGYIHTNAININGSVTPPSANKMPAGTRIYP